MTSPQTAVLVFVPILEDGPAASWIPPRILPGRSASGRAPEASTHWGGGLCTASHPVAVDDLQRGFAALVAWPAGLASAEYTLLHRTGAFTLPAKSVQKALVDAYFAWIAPVSPSLNRTDFMRRFVDTECPSSYLLMQSVFLAGCRVCRHPTICDADGSTGSADPIAHGHSARNGAIKSCPQMPPDSMGTFASSVLRNLSETPLAQTITNAGEGCLTSTSNGHLGPRLRIDYRFWSGSMAAASRRAPRPSTMLRASYWNPRRWICQWSLWL